MKLSLFDYKLPEELIAREPVYPREEANLMFVNRSRSLIKEGKIKDLLDFLNEDWVVVLNDTRVFPARLIGRKETGGKVELLLLRQDGDCWWAIGKPSLRLGQILVFNDLKGEVIDKKNEELLLEFNLKGKEFEVAMEREGIMPLPPYIKTVDGEEKIREDYQTVYAKKDGSVAAPTAGLHFSEDMFLVLRDKGVEIEFVTLHVGLGTFQGVKKEDVTKHQMHFERYELSEEVAERLNKAKNGGKKILAVGTTTARVLESCADKNGRLVGNSGETKIFIYPPYKFGFVDALLTNFHLPKSTLLMLVSALASLPNTKDKFKSFDKSLVGKAYGRAIERRWRFYSFGDAMLIV